MLTHSWGNIPFYRVHYVRVRQNVDWSNVVTNQSNAAIILYYV